jgi:hypothetical protein
MSPTARPAAERRVYSFFRRAAAPGGAGATPELKVDILLTKPYQVQMDQEATGADESTGTS